MLVGVQSTTYIKTSVGLVDLIRRLGLFLVSGDKFCLNSIRDSDMLSQFFRTIYKRVGLLYTFTQTEKRGL